MATPTYSGKAQQPTSVSSWLGSWLGGTPTYVGAGQPVTKASMFGAAAPAYKAAPVAPVATVATNAPSTVDPRDLPPFAILIERSQS